MAHNMDMKKGLYPDEPGYSDWNIGDFKKELGIEGTLTKEFTYIQPSKFHQKLMKTGDLPLTGRSNDDVSYTDILVRNDYEMSNNKRYFQPKAWKCPKANVQLSCTVSTALYGETNQPKIIQVNAVA